LRRNKLLARLDKLQQRIVLRVGRIELRVGDSFKCPHGHEAIIVWISEDKKVVAVRCPQKHLKKVVKVADHKRPAMSGHRPRKERRIYVKNMVFLIKI
ncbi:hypothetical protein GTO27_06340, partial [Candidatus Bathyarchaeota archaeon]|nr:hypothetical protein [Candidatus Bathyarchaeota archaeon]